MHRGSCMFSFSQEKGIFLGRLSQEDFPEKACERVHQFSRDSTFFPLLLYLVSQYAVKVQRSLAPLSRFRGSHITTAHAHQYCRFQSYAETVPSPMKFTSEIYKAWTTFLGSTTTEALWRMTLTAYMQMHCEKCHPLAMKNLSIYAWDISALTSCEWAVIVLRNLEKEIFEGIFYLHGMSSTNVHSRPIYIGKNQNPKNLGFLLYRLHCQKNP